MHPDHPSPLSPTQDARRRWLRNTVGAGMAAALPGLLPGRAQALADPLLVGGLPVTCNLTLPVACVARAAATRRHDRRSRSSSSSTASTAAGPRSRNR